MQTNWCGWLPRQQNRASACSWSSGQVNVMMTLPGARRTLPSEAVPAPLVERELHRGSTSTLEMKDNGDLAAPAGCRSTTGFKPCGTESG